LVMLKIKYNNKWKRIKVGWQLCLNNQ